MSETDGRDKSFERIHRLAEQRALAEVDRASSDGTPALTVRGAAFVRLLDAETMVLHCPLEQKILLMEISPDIYFDTDDYVGQEVVLVHLGAISDEELSLRLEDAWHFRAPGQPAQNPS